LLKNLLHLNPEKRFSVEEAMKHPFLETILSEDKDPFQKCEEVIDESLNLNEKLDQNDIKSFIIF
jgi:serine/threonine protein kinase